MKRFLSTLGLWGSMAVSVMAASPALNLIQPRGAQRGQEVPLQFLGERLQDVAEIISYSPQIQIKEFKVESPQKVLVTAVVPGDCPLGEHVFRLRTASGLSYVRTFWVGQFPCVDEVEPNTTLETAQSIATNTTLHGITENEDVDYFRIEAKKGDRICVELEGIRLGVINMDAYVAILNAKKFELATCDDSALLMQDPHASVIAPEDGTYYIEVRDSSYVGNGNFMYRCHVGMFPRPTICYPAGGKAGTEVDVTLLGDPAGPSQMKVSAAGAPGDKLGVFAQLNGLSSPSSLPFRVTALDNVLEVEPNNNHAEAKAQPPGTAAPIALNGIIDKPGDEDWIKFTAKKDEKFDLVVYARSVRSPLDAVLEIYNADAAGLGGVDDNGASPDPRINGWVAPADGEYFVRVRDHLLRGGVDFVYRVEIAPPQVDLVASLTRFDRVDSQMRQFIPIPRGGVYSTPINVERVNCGGDVIWDAADLPPGVTMQADPLPGNLNQYVVTFTAAADAPLGGKLCGIKPKLADPNANLTGRYVQNLELVQGEPNNTPYYVVSSAKLPLAVVEESPFSIEIAKPPVPIVRNGTIDLKVTAKRKEGFKAPINVRMMWNPPGIGAPGIVTIPEAGTEVIYQLNANGEAEIKTWKIAMLGESDAGAGPIFNATPLCELTVAEPFMALKMEMAAAEQGKPCELLCKLEHARPFAGKAVLTLVGLPAKCESQVREITSADLEVRFPITTAADSPVGKHQQLFVQAIITENGAPIPCVIGSAGVLRIDAPPPAPPPAAPAEAAPAAAPAPAPAAEAPPPPLSRLEQLRQQAKGK